MKMDFDTLFEHTLERYQQGGFLLGDRVKFVKGWEKLSFFKNKGQSFLDIVKSCSEPGFDLNLRIGAIKSVRPTTTQNYTSGTESPDNIYVDLYVEYAPGLYRTPMTVPIEAIEWADDGINTGPVPDSLKRKSRVHGPEEIETTGAAGFNVNLTDKNAVLSTTLKVQSATSPSKNWKPLPTK